METYNLISCYFGGGTPFPGCTGAWLGLILLFFILIVAGKWLEAMNFNRVFGIAGAVLVYFILFLFTGSIGWSFILGLVGGVVLGFIGSLFGGGGDDF